MHARALEIAHPMTGAPMRFEADWQQLTQIPDVQHWKQLLALPGWEPVTASASSST